MLKAVIDAAVDVCTQPRSAVSHERVTRQWTSSVACPPVWAGLSAVDRGPPPSSLVPWSPLAAKTEGATGTRWSHTAVSCLELMQDASDDRTLVVRQVFPSPCFRGSYVLLHELAARRSSTVQRRDWLVSVCASAWLGPCVVPCSLMISVCRPQSFFGYCDVTTRALPAIRRPPACECASVCRVFVLDLSVLETDPGFQVLVLAVTRGTTAW